VLELARKQEQAEAEKRDKRNRRRRELYKLHEYDRKWKQAVELDKTFNRIKAHEKNAMPAEDVDIGAIRAEMALHGLSDLEQDENGHWIARAPTGVVWIAYFIIDGITGLTTIYWTRYDTLSRYTPKSFQDKYLKETKGRLQLMY
jgi:hypothetical protein